MNITDRQERQPNQHLNTHLQKWEEFYKRLSHIQWNGTVISVTIHKDDYERIMLAAYKAGMTKALSYVPDEAGYRFIADAITTARDETTKVV